MHSLAETRSSIAPERRSHSRFAIDAPLTIVAGRTNVGDIEVTRIEGCIVNVSVSAILIALDEPIEYDRIWIRVADGGESLSECVVVRLDAEGAQSHHYAVKFTCDWSATVISRLLASLQ
jgi:predicted ABC-type ATPase